MPEYVSSSMDNRDESEHGGEYSAEQFPILDKGDLCWIANLMPSKPDQTTLDDLNKTIAIGSQIMSKSGFDIMDVETRAARLTFFRILGFLDESHPLHQRFDMAEEKSLPMPTTFIGVQRVLSQAGIDGLQLFKNSKYPGVFHMTAFSAETRVRGLKAVGIDSVSIDNAPNLFFVHPEDILARLHNLQSHNLPVEHIKKHAPKVLTSTVGNINRRIEVLKSYGLNPTAIVRNYGAALAIDDTTLEKKLAHFQALTLDIPRVVTSNAQILALGMENINRKLAILGAAGVDAVAVVNDYPRLLAASDESVGRRIKYISRWAVVLGWEGKISDLLTHVPRLLTSSTNRLRLLARLAAHITDPRVKHMPVTTVQSALSFPLELHMFAAMDPDGYSVSLTGRYRRKVPTDRAERRELLEQRLRDPAIQSKLGQRIIDLYHSATAKDESDRQNNIISTLAS